MQCIDGKTRDVSDLKLNQTNWSLLTTRACGGRAGLRTLQQIGIRSYLPLTLFAIHTYQPRLCLLLSALCSEFFSQIYTCDLMTCGWNWYSRIVNV